MIATDEDALICDLAETYHLLGWRSVPVRLAATLACGLRDDSRIKMRMSGTRVSIDTMLRAVMADRLGFIAWSKTEDGQKGRKKPPSFVEMLTKEKEKEPDVVVFDSPDDFEAARQRIFNGG